MLYAVPKGRPDVFRNDESIRGQSWIEFHFGKKNRSVSDVILLNIPLNRVVNASRLQGPERIEDSCVYVAPDIEIVIGIRTRKFNAGGQVRVLIEINPNWYIL